MGQRSLAAVVILALALPLRAELAAKSCWVSDTSEDVSYYAATIDNPAANLVVSYEPMRFAQARDLGIVVVNGTFFSRRAPYADVLASDGREYHPRIRMMRPGDGRVIDLGQRWALGRLRRSKRLAVARGDDARETMDLYLGGGAILLLGSEDRSADNKPHGSTPGESFPPSVLERRTARTAVGLKTVGARQQLLIVGAPEPSKGEGATVSDMVRIMRGLGATDAVLFDGGGAAGFAAGIDSDDEIYSGPANPTEDLNPTHLAARACR